MKRTIGISWFIFIFLFCSPAESKQMPGDFSADIISSTAEGTMQMKLYTSGQKSRMEMPGSVMIVRRDLQLMWMVMPEQKMYMEHPINQAMSAQTQPEIEGESERIAMGSEIVNGKNAQKFKVSFEARGESGQIYQWMDGDTPVRTQAIDGSWTVDFKNIQTGSQPESLFDPPAGYQKMDIAGMAGAMQAVKDGIDGR